MEVDGCHKCRKRIPIRLSGLSPHCNMQDLRTFLQNYGTIRHLAALKGRHSVSVDYKYASDAQRLLNFGTIRFGEDILEVRESADQFSLSNMDIVHRAIHIFQAQPSLADFYTQVRTLRSKLELPETSVTKRKKFAKILNEYVQEFFVDPVRIEAFGSSFINLALCDADLDMCFYLEFPKVFESVDVSHLNLVDLTLAEVKTKRLNNNAFIALNLSQRAEFMFRVLKQFEVDTNLIEDVSFIGQARVPLIHFQHDDIPVDLSLFTKLGVRKSCFLKKTADQCFGMIEVLFVVRLWGRCAGLYKDKEHPLGCWTSYALSLLFFAFTQREGFYGELEDGQPINGVASGNALIYKGKPIENPFLLIKHFFQFCVDRLDKHPVFALNTAIIYNRCDFHVPGEVFGNRFRLTDVCNIQDPIDITHNVTQSLSSEYLAIFIEQARKSLRALEENMTCLSLFHALKKASPNESLHSDLFSM